MAYNREGYAPWSLTRKAGVQSATVNGDIEVPQYVQPVLDTGFVDEKGDWKGTKSSDETFFVSDTALAVANGASVLFPNTADRDFIDMTGFSDLAIALKPSNGGNVTIATVQGPATHSYANLSPINAGEGLKVAYDGDGTDAGLLDAFYDGTEAITVDVWSIFIIRGRLKNQKLLNFSITNNSGGNSNIDFAYMRLV
jgi:hypothetical protein